MNYGETVKTATVPGTDVEISVEIRRADFRLAEIMGDKPGTGRWVDNYVAVRYPGSHSDIVNYLLMGAADEKTARDKANFLWNDTVIRRNARNAQK